MQPWFLPDTLQDSSIEYGEYLLSEDVYKILESCHLYEAYPHQEFGKNRALITYFGGLNKKRNIASHCLYLPDEVTPAHETFSMEEMHLIKQTHFESTPFMKVREEAFLTGQSFSMMPLSHVRVGMSLPIDGERHVLPDRVRSIQMIDYEGEVYDLDVENHHNYFANSVVVHNCIYGFRNADIRNILEFEKDYKEAKVITLDRNYRSTQQILDVANRVIANNRNQRKKTLWTDNTDGAAVTYRVLKNGREEAEYIATEIERLSPLYELKDFAILYRLNAASRVFEDAMMSHGIAYDLIGALNFYERKEIKDVIAYLRLMDNPEDDMSLRRVINVPKRGIGQGTLDKAQAYATENDISLWQALIESENYLSKTPLQKVQDFMGLMTNLRIESSSLGPGMMIDAILEDTGYRADLIKQKSPEADDRLQNLEEFLNVAWEYQQIEGEEPTLTGLLERITLNQNTSEDDDEEKNDNFIRMMTIHASKGLEYKVVFVVGMEENLLPFYKSIADGNIEEERRLCYVALTRAKERLYVSRAEERHMYNDVNYNDPSRFIEEMGLEDSTNESGYILPW